jgi:tetratricopeptide (TPR) repeat protein
MTSVAEWMKLAPKPRPRANGEQWDVFVSYRSVSRLWATALYDALRQCDYHVFLDQYCLCADDRLNATLAHHMSQSAAGVLVWSPESADSEWCKKEFNALEQLESASKDRGDDEASRFRYVVVRLDNAVLPLFAAQKIWIDFGSSREAPVGSSLLRLMYGLRGGALPREAVRLADAVDQETKVSCARIEAARSGGDAEALRGLAATQSLAWRTSAALGCRVAQALISLKKNDDALSLLDGVLNEFPRSIRPRQLQGLALARKGEWRSAQAVLGELYFLGERDPETVGILARTWRDRFTQTGDSLCLRKARDLYAEAFKAAPKDYYTGVNAAANSLLLGDAAAAERYADAVQRIVGDVPVPGDYWLTATIAEVLLIRRDYERAKTIYAAAVAMFPAAKGDHESTLGQARRLMDRIGPTKAEREGIESAFA